MRFQPRKILTLKPFDESEDKPVSEVSYINSWILTLGILLATITSFIGVVLIVMGKPEYALKMILVSIAFSAINAGMEWMHGLKATALNLLFSLVVMIAFIALLQTTTHVV